MSSYIFRVMYSDHRIVEIPLDEALTLTAEAGAVYAVLDAESHQIIQQIKLKQEDDALVIEVDEDVVVQVDGFYTAGQETYVDAGWQNAAGEALLYASHDAAVQNSDLVWQHADDHTEAMADGGMSTGAILFASAAALGGFVALANQGGSGTAAAGPDTTIVVFDLVNGVSSNHGTQAFDANVAYTIYIHVNSVSTNLFTTPQGQNPNTFTSWTNGAGLGADDVIIVVGTGQPVLGFSSRSVNAIGGGSVVIRWQSNFSTAVGVWQNGVISRPFSSATSSARGIWTGIWVRWTPWAGQLVRLFKMYSFRSYFCLCGLQGCCCAEV